MLPRYRTAMRRAAAAIGLLLAMQVVPATAADGGAPPAIAMLGCLVQLVPQTLTPGPFAQACSLTPTGYLRTILSAEGATGGTTQPATAVQFGLLDANGNFNPGGTATNPFNIVAPNGIAIAGAANTYLAGAPFDGTVATYLNGQNQGYPFFLNVRTIPPSGLADRTLDSQTGTPEGFGAQSQVPSADPYYATSTLVAPMTAQASITPKSAAGTIAFLELANIGTTTQQWVIIYDGAVPASGTSGNLTTSLIRWRAPLPPAAAAGGAATPVTLPSNLIVPCLNGCSVLISTTTPYSATPTYTAGSASGEVYYK